MAEVTQEQIDAWKKKFGAVLLYETEDGKQAYFRKPYRRIAGYVATIGDPVASNEALAKNCFLGGDGEVISDDEYFFGLSRKLPGLMKIKLRELKELRPRPGKELESRVFY
jgi:hypothetical protein